MTLQDTFTGALLFKTSMLTALRERSDVFWRGFLVLLVAALIAGAVGSLRGAFGELGSTVSEEQVIQTALASFESSYNGPPDLKPVMQSMVREVAGMVYELLSLPPRAGEGARPIIAILHWLGETLAAPFSFAFIGWTLFAGLVFQLTSSWFGGRAHLAQMLGLTALAAAPQALTAIPNLLTLLAEMTNASALTLANGLLGLLIGAWSLLIYVKATSVAQQFSIGKAVGAIVVGLLIMIAVLIVLTIVVAIAVGVLIGAIGSAAR